MTKDQVFAILKTCSPRIRQTMCTLQDWRPNKTIDQNQHRMGISQEKARRLIWAYQLPYRHKCKANPWRRAFASRAHLKKYAMHLLHEQGLSYTMIGYIFRVSRQRADQCIKEARRYSPDEMSALRRQQDRRRKL